MPDEEWKRYWADAYEEEGRDLREEAGLGSAKLTTFVSRSQGRDRPPRKYPRTIELLDVGGTVYVVNGDEIKTRRRGGIRPDVAVMSVLDGPDDKRTPEELLRRLRAIGGKSRKRL